MTPTLNNPDDALADSDTYFRCAYIPFVALNIAWDYADTVCDISAILRDERIKPLTRAVRKLRRDYDSFRRPFLTSDILRQETAHAEEFLAKNDDVLNHIVICLRARLVALSPALKGDELLMMIAVYQALIIIKATRMYAADADRLLDASGVRGRHSILPNEALALFDLMELYIGDFPLKPSDPLLCRFAQSLYISLSQIEFAPDPD